MATSRSKAKKRPTHVAVVIANRTSGRPFGDWACFVGPDRDAVVTQARRARRAWTTGRYSGYEIHVGTLDSKVMVPPPIYTLAPLGE